MVSETELSVGVPAGKVMHKEMPASVLSEFVAEVAQKEMYAAREKVYAALFLAVAMAALELVDECALEAVAALDLLLHVQQQMHMLV